MNSNLIRCMPVFILALSLAACGKDAAKKTGGGEAAPAIAAASIATTFESDCGAAAAGASANSAFDLSQCQLNQSQMALLQEVGPFKVEADCVHQSVVIKNAADQVNGAGAINEDGTFSLPLVIGARFSELEGCPVKLEGLATGKVTCDADKKLVSVDVNTTFNFSHIPTEGAAMALEFAMAEEPAPAPAPVTPAPDAPVPAPTVPAPTVPAPDRDRDHDRDRDRDHDRDHRVPGKGGQEGGKTAPIPVPATKGGQDKGKIVPVPAPVLVPATKGSQGGQDKGKTVPIPATKGTQSGKGTQGGKGGSQGGPTVPGAPVNACVSFTPCGFSTSASMSCAR